MLSLSAELKQSPGLVFITGINLGFCSVLQPPWRRKKSEFTLVILISPKHQFYLHLLSYSVHLIFFFLCIAPPLPWQRNGPMFLVFFVDNNFLFWFLWSRCFSKLIISLEISWKCWHLCPVLSSAMHALSCRTEAAAGVRPGYSHSVTLGSYRWDCHFCTSATAWQNIIPVHDQNSKGKKGLCWAFLISLGTGKCWAWLLGAKIKYHVALLSPQLLLHSLTFPQAAAG